MPKPPHRPFGQVLPLRREAAEQTAPRPEQPQEAANDIRRAPSNTFTFASPADRAEWQRRAYAQAVHPDNWHLGDPIDPDTARTLAAGIAGPTAPTYRGPDGRDYFANARTIEPESWREIRTRHFRGRTIAELEQEAERTGRMPGEAEALGRAAAIPAARVPQITGTPIAATLTANDSDSATLPPSGRAILAGMERARQNDPQIVARLAQVPDGRAPDGQAPDQQSDDTLSDAEPASILPAETQPAAGTGPRRRSPDITGEQRRPQPLPGLERDYDKEPEPVPASLLPPADSRKPWPTIPDTWVMLNRDGYAAFTPEASRELDRYREVMRAESYKYSDRTNETAPGFAADAGAFMRHYLEGSGETISLYVTDQLLAGDNVKSANEGLNQHIVDWLVIPGKSGQSSEQIIPKILALRDGESTSVPSMWDGATNLSRDYFAEAVMRTLGTPLPNDFIDRSEAHFASLGHVQIHGDAMATVTRRGDRYFVIVDITKTLKDIYDYTDDDGEHEANERIREINDRRDKKQVPWLLLDTAKLNLLAKTGRAKPFAVTTEPWKERLTLELRNSPHATRSRITPRLEVVPNTISWQKLPGTSQ